MKNKQETKKKTGNNRDYQGKFVPGVSGNLSGRPPETLEQKLIKRAVKELIKEYEESLSEALPKLSSILKNKALSGDMVAIKELHEVVGVKRNYNPVAAFQINIQEDREKYSKNQDLTK